MDPETSLASKEDRRTQPEVTQGEVPSDHPTNHDKDRFSTATMPISSQPSATVNPLGSPACLRDGAPNRTVHGPGLKWDMLTSPRCSKSRLHRQRIGAKFSRQLIPPLTGPLLAGHCELFPWSSSAAVWSPDSGKHVQSCQAYLLHPDSGALASVTLPRR